MNQPGTRGIRTKGSLLYYGRTQHTRLYGQKDAWIMDAVDGVWAVFDPDNVPVPYSYPVLCSLPDATAVTLMSAHARIAKRRFFFWRMTYVGSPSARTNLPSPQSWRTPMFPEAPSGNDSEDARWTRPCANNWQ